MNVVVVVLLVVAAVAALLLAANVVGKVRTAVGSRKKPPGGVTDLTAGAGLSSAAKMATAFDEKSTARAPHSIAVGWHPQRSPLGRRYLVTAQLDVPILALGAAGSGKTSGLAIPAIREYGSTGPVLGLSIKFDLMKATLAARAAAGRVFAFDPGNTLPPELVRYRMK